MGIGPMNGLAPGSREWGMGPVVMTAQSESVGVAPSVESGCADDSVLFETGSVSCWLPVTLQAVPRGRAVVRRGLIHLDAESVTDDVALVATELITNALEHGVGAASTGAPTSESALRELRRGSGVQISLSVSGSHIVLAVSDPNPATPVRRPRDTFSGGGRGLQLVESLSLCWGWTLLDEQNGRRQPGKSVWAMFARTATNRPAAQIRIVGAA